MSYPIRISRSLSHFLQVDPKTIFTRLQVNRLLWNYIVLHKLLDVHNSKKIRPNAELMEIFCLSPGETLNLFGFLNHITPHIRRL